MTLAKAAGIRALRTFIQVIVGAGATVGIVSATTDWIGVGLAVVNILVPAAVAALFAFLQGILAGLPEVKEPEKG